MFILLQVSETLQFSQKICYKQLSRFIPWLSFCEKTYQRVTQITTETRPESQVMKCQDGTVNVTGKSALQAPHILSTPGIFRMIVYIYVCINTCVYIYDIYIYIRV